MHSVFALLLSLSILSPLSALAGSSHLFKVVKPVNPQNIIQVDAMVSPSCSLNGLDFYYLMNGLTPKRSLIEGSIRKMIPIIPAKPDNAAACAADAETDCYQEFVKIPFVNLVNHGLKDPSLVVKAQLVDGKCSVGAYMDIGSRVIQVKKVAANGTSEVHLFSQSATITIRSVTVWGSEGFNATWYCNSNCVTEAHL